MAQEQTPTESARFERWFEVEVVQPIADFQDPKQEWRRLFSELLGTFFLVLVAAGGGMMSQAFPNTISRGAAVTAPGLMVMAIILFMGKVSGAHLNPAVSLAFSLRGDFPWRRVPGYIVAQLAGATLAALFLRSVVGVSATFGSNYPAAGYSSFDAYLMEAVLTLGLVSVILGTASGAQNLGVIGALGVGAYIILAGLWGSPISGASMTPARTFGPDLVGAKFTDYWVYVAGPLTGAAIAVGFAFLLRGYGGGRSGSAAAQGVLDTEVKRPSSNERPISPRPPSARGHPEAFRALTSGVYVVHGCCLGVSVRWNGGRSRGRSGFDHVGSAMFENRVSRRLPSSSTDVIAHTFRSTQAGCLSTRRVRTAHVASTTPRTGTWPSSTIAEGCAGRRAGSAPKWPETMPSTGTRAVEPLAARRDLACSAG